MKKYILAAIATGAVLAASSASAITYNISNPVVLPSGNLGNPFGDDLEALFGVGDVGFGLVQSAEATDDGSYSFEFFKAQSGFDNKFTFGNNGSILEPSGDRIPIAVSV